jgi:hypothetical protein
MKEPYFKYQYKGLEIFELIDEDSTTNDVNRLETIATYGSEYGVGRITIKDGSDWTEITTNKVVMLDRDNL